MDRDEEGGLVNILSLQDVLPDTGRDEVCRKNSGIVSRVPVGGSAKMGTATVTRRVTAGCTSRTPTLACTSETAVVSVPIMVFSWARVE